MQNNYFPATYQPYYQYQQPTYQPQTNYTSQSGITWVDGVSSARAYPVANGTSILLMNSNENVFYIKSADQSGMPSIRIYDYSERVITQPTTQPQVVQPVQEVPVQSETIQAESIDMSNYVTKEELNKAKQAIEEKIDNISSSILGQSSNASSAQKAKR